MNQVEKLRHHGECRDVALAQSPHQFGGIESFEIDDARALDQRQQQIRHLRQHVKQRQDAKQRVAGPEIDPIENSFHLAQECWRE